MTKITVDKALIEQAIDALEMGLRFRETGLGRPPEQYAPPAIDALRAALTGSVVEPVAEVIECGNLYEKVKLLVDALGSTNAEYKFYTSSPLSVEPVGYASIDDLRQLQYCNGMGIWCEGPSMWGPKEQAPPPPENLVAIYTSPPPPAVVPLLTIDEIRDVADKADEGQESTEFMLAFARGIEHAVRHNAKL